MVRATQLALLALNAFAMQDASARVTSRNAVNEFGRSAEIDEFKKFEAVEEDAIFFRALQMSMSMSMSMSMGMDVMQEEETPVDGATGQSPGETGGSDSEGSGFVDDVATETMEDQNTPKEETPIVVLEPLAGAEDDSSAPRVFVGLSGFVGLMGMLVL
jgi:hypothetical protein